MSASQEIHVFPTLEQLFQSAADEFVKQVKDAVRKNGRFTVALSGGSTPKGLFALLASEYKDLLPWDKMYFFWGDERHVPPDHPESNYRMADEAMLSKLPHLAKNIFRVPAEKLDAAAAAREYEQTLRQFFRLQADELPNFNLIMLGMGPDGHTASLFPYSAALQEKHRLVTENWVEKFDTFRITATVPVLNNADEIMFLISGADKAMALREVLEGSGTEQQYPAKLVQPTHGTVLWFIEQSAAGELSNAASKVKRN
ncbi:MAG TPA: 6-phosphogluconolactonase [Terriglobales bacterium]|nr:6-phosphogluconolactonase [Terriglobales bacterium]